MVSQELSSWKMAAIMLTTISITILIIQRTSWAFLDPIFEICIFHIPAILAIGVYFYQIKNSKAFNLQTNSKSSELANPE